MSKTKDAFALRDFDRTRILQRPYFKDFNFDKDLTDEKILSSLSAQIGDSITELERKNETLSKIYSRLRKYTEHVLKHMVKVGHYRRYQRADDFAHKVTLAFFELTNFEEAAKISLRNSESILRKRYRDRFAQRLKRARERAGLSRRDVAQMLGYTTNGFAELEKPRSEPNLTALIRLSRNLNVSTDWLLGLK